MRESRLPRKTISPYVIRTKGDELNLGKCRRDHHDEIRIRLAHRHKPASRCIQKLPCLTAAGRQAPVVLEPVPRNPLQLRSEEHTSELQSLMRSSYAVFCLKQTNINTTKSQ